MQRGVQLREAVSEVEDVGDQETRAVGCQAQHAGDLTYRELADRRRTRPAIPEETFTTGTGEHGRLGVPFAQILKQVVELTRLSHRNPALFGQRELQPVTGLGERPRAFHVPILPSATDNEVRRDHR